MIKKCIGCGSLLQTDNPQDQGFTIDMSKDYCRRCFKLKNYGKSNIGKIKYANDELIAIINENNFYKIFLTDILNINKEVLESFSKLKEPKILVISKSDIIPKSIKQSRIISFLRAIYDINSEIIFINNKNNINNNFIIKKLEELKLKKAYLIGYTNAGKSTLINKLSNQKIITSNLYNTTLDFINISFADNYTLIDTPGLILKNNLFLATEIDLIKRFNTFKTIKPITYQTKENTIINIENKLEISHTGRNSITLYFNPNIKINKQYKSSLVIKSYKYELPDNVDIVIKGIGFINVKKSSTLEIKIDNPDLIEIRPSLFRK